MGSITYLLDTHVLLWFIYRKDLIKNDIIEIILKENILISSVTFWEISIKFNKGTLDLLGKTPTDIRNICFNDLHFSSLDLDSVTAASQFQLSANHHRDPFDRMLIWQALQKDLTLITNDVNINRYQDIGLKLLW